MKLYFLKVLLCVSKIKVLSFSFNYTDAKVQQVNTNTTINTASKKQD